MAASACPPPSPCWRNAASANSWSKQARYFAAHSCQADLADEIVLYQAGKILGGNARSLFDLPENPAALQQPTSWQTRSVTILDGGDLKQVLRKKEAV